MAKEKTQRTKRNRFRQLRDELGISQQKLAGRLDVDYTTVQRLEKGRNRPSDLTLLAYERVFGISRDWLLGKTDKRLQTYSGTGRGLHRVEGQPPRFTGHDRPQDLETEELPLHGTIPAGSPADVTQTEETYAVLRHLAAPGRYVLRVQGDSMHPELRDHDLVLMEHRDVVDATEVEGLVCAVMLEGEATLKRVHFERRNAKRRLVLDADNPLYPAVVPDEGEEVKIIGVAISLVHRDL